MGWSFRKSWRLLPGLRISLSKRCPRLSVGVPGARASVDMHGKARIYGGKGPLRYQRTIQIEAQERSRTEKADSILSFLKKLLR
jgi:hypothetical protein